MARSARDGILSIGPSALPHLRRVREGREGASASRLDGLIREISNPGRGGTRAARSGAGGPQGTTSMLAMQLRAINRLIDVSEEQMKQLRLAFVTLAPIEDEIRSDARAGKRENMPQRRRDLLEKSQVIVKRILTEEQWERWESMRRTRRRVGGTPSTNEGAREGGGKR